MAGLMITGGILSCLLASGETKGGKALVGGLFFLSP
jgi:hypothetical protein